MVISENNRSLQLKMILQFFQKQVGLNFKRNYTSAFIYWNNVISMPGIAFNWIFDKLLKPADNQLVFQKGASEDGWCTVNKLVY